MCFAKRKKYREYTYAQLQPNKAEYNHAICLLKHIKHIASNGRYTNL